MSAGGQYGFALAGGHAVAAHGILDRHSEDVDLFADWQRRADFDAAISRGRYTVQRLCQIAQDADPGFDRGFFTNMLRHVERFDDDDFADYGLTAGEVADLKRRVAGWREELAS